MMNLKTVCIVLGLTILYSITSFAQSTIELQRLRDQVVSGQITPDEAIRRAEELQKEQQSQTALQQDNAQITRDTAVSKTFNLVTDPNFAEIGGKEGQTTVSLTNPGEKRVIWSVKSNSDWLRIRSSRTGYLEPGAMDSIIVSFDRNITEEERRGSLVFTINNNPETGLEYPVYQSAIIDPDDEKTYFGYDVFKGASDKYNYGSFGPVDPNYAVGPGDELIISMWGQTEMQRELSVSPEGTIFFENVGQISVNGLTMKELKDKLTVRLSEAYSTLNPSSGNATTFLDVSLGKLKPISVFVVGNVRLSGMHVISSYSSIFTALYKAGGPVTDGTLREIQVIRNGKTIATIDLYNYLTRGETVSDVRLVNEDVIFVPHRITSVEIDGEVNRPAVYELKEDETLQDLVRFADGIKSTASLDRVVIERILPFEQRDTSARNTTVIDGQLGTVSNRKIQINPIPIYDNDIVTVHAIDDRQYEFVEVFGAVRQEGKFSHEEGMTVNDLIKKAQGLQDEAYLRKADLTRTRPNGEEIFFDIDLTLKEYQNFVLEEWDRLEVYSIWDLRKRDSVSISGHIPLPGKYAYAKNMKASDLIFRAGGLEDSLYRNKTYLLRADIIRLNPDNTTTSVVPFNLGQVLKGDRHENPILQPGDSLIIYSRNVIDFDKEVTIRGEIKDPGTFELQSNMTVKDLILQAGGFTVKAYKYVVDVYRIDPFNITPNRLAVTHSVEISPELLLTNEAGDNFQLEHEDIVAVRKHPFYELQRTVTIEGEVKFPGVYALTDKKTSLCDLVEITGGFTDEAFIEGIQIYRDSVQVVGNFKKTLQCRGDDQLVLRSGDVIQVPKRPGAVLVLGNVNNPGAVQYKKGWGVNDYVEAAGNYDIEALKRKTVVYLPGGAAKKKGFIFHPRVKEGSMIVVPEKPPREPVDMTDLLARWAQIISGLATTVFIIHQTTN